MTDVSIEISCTVKIHFKNSGEINYTENKIVPMHLLSSGFLFIRFSIDYTSHSIFLVSFESIMLQISEI